MTPLSAGRRQIITCTVMAATLMQSLDSTIANVALPYMRGPMGANQDQINWVLTSYIVAAAIMTSPTAWLSQRLGRTRLFILSVSGFTVASVLCGLSETIGQIVVFRIFQGICGASLVPLGQSVMFDTTTLEQRGAAMAMWGMGVMVGPVLGPTLGGWLTENYSWRWVFYINLPIGVLAVLGLVRFLPETPRRRNPFDWTGFLLLSLAVGGLQLMLDRGESLDWFDSREIIIEACSAGLAFYCFLVHLNLANAPFVSPLLFRDRNFLLGTSFVFLIGMGLFATMALLAPYLQSLMNYPVLTAGIALAPRGLGTIAGMFVAGRLIGRLSVRILVMTGLGLTIVALLLMMRFSPDSSIGDIVFAGLLQGAGVGLVFVTMSTVTFTTLPPQLRTQGTSMYSLLRNLGSSIGISITGFLLLRNTRINHAEIVGGITPFDRALQQGAAAQLWNPLSAHGAAALDAEIDRQATIIAYTNDFKLLLWVTLIAVPLACLLRSHRHAPEEGEVVLPE